MKKNSLVKRTLAAAFAGSMVLAMTGCASSSSSQTTQPEKKTEEAKKDDEKKPEESKKPEEDKKLSGKITLAGSTSMQKVATALCESFMEKYGDVTATAEFSGSGAGIESVISGKVDIGNSSRNLKDTEKEGGAVENIIAIDGIAVVADKDNGVDDLTKDQLISIYTGETTNWSDLGGSNEPIVVIGREAGSGTRGAFEELLKIEDQCAYANELDSTGAVLAKVASTPGSIGYVSLDVVDDTVKAFKLDGVEATEENIKAGDYFLCRPFVMATKGEIKDQNEIVQAWFDFVYGEEGQAIVKKVGLITVEKQ